MVITNRFIRLPKVKEKTGLSRSTIYQRMGEGKFPRHINLGGRATAWLEHEVDAWIAGRIEAREGYHAPV